MSVSTQIQRSAIRVLGRAGGSSLFADKERRAALGRLLTKGAHKGFEAQAAVGRVFAARTGDRPDRPAHTTASGLFDLTPTDDQAMLRDAAKDLADEVLRPAGAAADTARAIPAEVAAAGAEMGLHLLGVPAGLDGIAEEASAVAGVLVLEQLARGDMGLAVALMGTTSVATALALYGSAGQQATYLPHFTAEQPVTAALAIQEPHPLFDALAPRTTASRQGDQLVLNGQKSLVARAAEAELFVISATVDGVARLLVVEANTPGLTIEDEPAMGVRAAATGRLVLTDAQVPAANLLGTAEDHVDAVRRARVAWCALAVGTGQAVLDQVSTYVTERKAFGEPIAHRQAVAFLVADIAIELDALRLATWRAASLLDAGEDAREAVAHARSLASRHGIRIGSDGVQLLGGHGFVKEFDNERWYRDLRGAGLLDGIVLV